MQYKVWIEGSIGREYVIEAEEAWRAEDYAVELMSEEIIDPADLDYRMEAVEISAEP